MLTPLSLRDVQVGGEIGRHIIVTITNNLLVLDADHDFLPPFRARTNRDGYLALDSASLTDSVKSDVVRPAGLGCRVQAWKLGFGLGKSGDFALTLTEFPDPDGKATYFRLRDFSVAVEDELFADKVK